MAPTPPPQLDRLLARVHALAPLRTAVVHPCDARALAGALEAAERRLIAPVLVGPRARIEQAARETERSLEGIEAGNVAAKQLPWLAGARSAGVVMGARVPVVLTSRADGRLARQAACAVAMLVARHHRLKPDTP